MAFHSFRRPGSWFVFLLSVSLLAGCSNEGATGSASSGGNEAGNNGADTSADAPAGQGGIVGEWEQRYTCFDKNANLILDPEEKTPSGTPLGFDWFRFNADGTCLRDKDMKFEGTYTIEEKEGGEKKLLIEGGDKLSYSIAELSDRELVIGKDGAFIVFERTK